jgi:NAD(P)H dehydrogenase (quinone)
MSLAVTGATGHFGHLVIEHLLARGTAPAGIVALVRDPGRADDLATKGVTVRAFDYDQPTSAALAGVDSLLLVSGTAFGRRFEQHRAVIDAAKAAGVARVLYTSAPGADASINPVAPEHKATEEYLATSGVPFVVLRNGWYHENYLPTLQTAAQTGEVLTAAGDGRVASAARGDLAEAAAVVLGGQETGRTYELTGDVAWSFEELAADLSSVLGREIVAHHVSTAEEARLLIEAGLDAGTIGFVTGVDAAIAAGELGRVNGELSTLIGHPTAPIVDTLRSAS